MFINRNTGHATPSTDEQRQEQAVQILWINGIEAVDNPPIWVGPWNGEMFFYPSRFENEAGGEDLNIPIGNVILTGIHNITFGNYELHFRRNGIDNIKQVQGLHAGITSLTQE